MEGSNTRFSQHSRPFSNPGDLFYLINSDTYEAIYSAILSNIIGLSDLHLASLVLHPMQEHPGICVLT